MYVVQYRRRAIRALPDWRRRVRARCLAAHARVLPAGPDVPHARERPLPRVARRVPPGRCPDGAGRLQPLRRLRAGPGDAHGVRAGPARAGARPRRLARRGRRRPADRVAGRHGARPLARVRGVPPPVRQHDDRPGRPRRRDSAAGRQARHAAADRARRADGGRQLPRAGPLLPRHDRADAAAVRARRRLRRADRQRGLHAGSGRLEPARHRHGRRRLGRRSLGVHRAEPAPRVVGGRGAGRRLARPARVRRRAGGRMPAHRGGRVGRHAGRGPASSAGGRAGAPPAEPADRAGRGTAVRDRRPPLRRVSGRTDRGHHPRHRRHGLDRRDARCRS